MQNPKMNYNRARLLELVRRDALRFGDFTLASGVKSHFYIDCRNVTLSAEGAALIGAGVLEALAEEDIDAVGGMTIGADPIVAAALVRAGLVDRPLRGFLVRKEAKEHGTGKQIEGPVRVGDRVAIVEDVSTTGGSCQRAIDAARAAGCDVVHVVAVLDRQQGAREVFEKQGIRFSPLLTLADLGL